MRRVSSGVVWGAVLAGLSVSILCASVWQGRFVLASGAPAEAEGVDVGGTGAFRIEKQGGRYCLVTPAGQRFFALGVNHIRAISRESKWDVLKEKYGRDWSKVSEKAVADLRAWGFNTAGYGSPSPMWKKMPFMAEIHVANNSNWRPDDEFEYPDVFDPRFGEQTTKRVRRLCLSVRENSNLVGYYWTDSPQWDIWRARGKRGTDWVSTIRSKDKSAPGKRRYVEFLERKYGMDRSRFCEIYELDIRSFEDLLAQDFKSLNLALSVICQDDEEFLGVIAREYYRVVGEATRRFDPNHLVFGERYRIDDHPDQVLSEAVPYIDVLSIEPSGAAVFDREAFDRLHRQTGKPVNVCDHQVSFFTEEYPKTMWKQVPSEEAAGKAYARYLEAAFAAPYVVGYHRCQYINRFDSRVGLLKQGLLREDERPYAVLTEHVRRANLEVQRRLSAARP